jgi:peptidoglycan L-alanyl-D-glutamate endopeptidase CwlK
MMLDAEMSEALGVTQGLRTAGEQQALWAQGRDTLPKVNAYRQAVGWAPIKNADNVKVTNAAPGYSWHEFGLAVDVVPFESSNAPDWNENHPVWQELVAKGKALGLTSGISWRDEPHFQITGIFPVTPSDEVRTLFAESGLQSVWTAAEIVS